MCRADKVVVADRDLDKSLEILRVALAERDFVFVSDAVAVPDRDNAAVGDMETVALRSDVSDAADSVLLADLSSVLVGDVEGVTVVDGLADTDT